MLKWCISPTSQTRNDIRGGVVMNCNEKDILQQVLKKVEIKNASFTFIAKLWDFIVCHYLNFSGGKFL